MRTLMLIVAFGSLFSATAQNENGPIPTGHIEGSWNTDQFTRTDLGPVTLFPNPASDQVSVAFPALAGEAIVSLVDGSGRVLRMDQVNQVAGQLHILEVSDLPDGVYLINVEQEGQRVTERLVIAHGDR